MASACLATTSATFAPSTGLRVSVGPKATAVRALPSLHRRRQAVTVRATAEQKVAQGIKRVLSLHHVCE